MKQTLFDEDMHSNINKGNMSLLKSDVYKKPCLKNSDEMSKDKLKVKFASINESDDILKCENVTRVSSGSEPTIPTQSGIQKCDFEDVYQ